MTRWLLKTVAADGAAYGDFVWPLEVGAEVTAPDWSDAPKCGGGLHGLLDGRGDGALLDWSPDAVWLVAEVPADAHLVDLDGKVKVKVPAGTQSHQTLRLKNKGIPRLGGYGRGDQLLRILVETPTKLSTKQKELLQEFEKSSGSE